ncbi:Elicitin-like protein, partial [Globisporangium splendens]
MEGRQRHPEFPKCRRILVSALETFVGSPSSGGFSGTYFARKTGTALAAAIAMQWQIHLAITPLLMRTSSSTQVGSVWDYTTFLLVVISALLSTCVQQTEAVSCDLMRIFLLVKPLETNPNMVACIAATGYEMLPPAGPPTDAQFTKLCATSTCISAFNTLQKMSIPDCTIDILGGLNIRQVFDGVVDRCALTKTNGNASNGDSYANKATTAAASSTPTMAPSVKGTTSAKATAEPTIEPQMCV